jgi:hypothetical protein
MIQLAALVDPDARAIRQRYEEEVESVIAKNSERVAQARFAVYGTGIYPDATGTLRVSFGSVKGYEENGKHVEPFTTFGAAFARATGEEPFALPPRWLKAQSLLDMKTPFNFVADTDIIGGNSGSPMLNQDAELIGLVFDGNRHSHGAAYGFDPAVNRTVAVHGSALLEALKVYGATRLLEEMHVPAKSPAVASPPTR